MKDMEKDFEQIGKEITKMKKSVAARDVVNRTEELLKENGVVVNVTMCTFDGVTEMSIGLDFTEHDKVFEDKIAEMKSEISILKSLVENYRASRREIISENDELKIRISELENENKNLNIRIFQNEAYGDKKIQKINLNDRIKVKLTPLGVKIYYHQYDELNKKIKENGGTELEPRMPEIDKDGFTEFTLWNFMELYGEHIGMCKQNVILPLNIIISE